MLSAIPSKLDGINDGLSTLQWIKVTASPHNPQLLQGGTQDNGTWETPGNPVKWENTMIGDGGWNGFDAANPNFRFHSFFDVSPEVNFEGGNMASWISIYDPLRARRLELLLADHQRPGGERLDVRRHRADGVPDEDARPRHDDDGRGAAALQLMDGRLRRHLR